MLHIIFRNIFQGVLFSIGGWIAEKILSRPQTSQMKLVILKMQNVLHRLLLHPMVTLITVVTGVLSGAAIFGAEIQQIGVQLGPLAAVIPSSSHIIVTLTMVSTVCTVFAGVGRSIVSFVDKNQPPPALPS